MVKIKYFVFAMLSLGLIACQKEELLRNVSNNSSKISNYEESQTRKFKKEIVVYDDSNRNYVMIALHSDDENIISDFLDNYGMKINTSESDIYTTIDTPTNNSKVEDSELRVDMDTEPKIVIELIKQSIDSNNKYFSLNFERKDLNKSGYISG